MAGYSDRQLFQKLGLRSGMSGALIAAPDNYQQLLGKGAPDIIWRSKVFEGCDIGHVFTTSRPELCQHCTDFRAQMARDGMLWVSWPKKSSKVATTVTEDVIREAALPLGLVDIKVCAVDSTWSGLKLVIRKELR
ncbi:hypothetical protein NBRC116601_24810 [Cognatishimia sp. WU-CL00825]|uniref:DUF3052 family protein n=1 Tax=Cognatishimia sp. WU-CL00825 TaxID=3127658 RepID=UPI003108D530